MATEKLTKKRLLQILLMLIILMSAFFYKTYQHNASADTKSAVENVEVSEK